MDTYPNRIISPILNLHPPDSNETLYQSTLDYFLSIPWTSKLLTTPSTPSGPKPIPFTPTCKNPASSEYDQLYGRTLNQPDGLPYMLSFFHPTPGAVDDRSVVIDRVQTLFTIGPGLSGLPGIIHGGMTMTCCDEAMAAIPEINSILRKEGEMFQTPSVTAGLEIKFIRPIEVNQVIMATAWIESRERRKTRVQCVVTDEEGTELVRCSSTWVAVKASL